MGYISTVRRRTSNPLNIMNPISQLINFLHLPPNQSSLNLISTIQHIHKSNYTLHYLFINDQYLLIYTFNHFHTLNNPITTHLTYHPTIQHLLNSIN